MFHEACTPGFNPFYPAVVCIMQLFLFLSLSQNVFLRFDTDCSFSRVYRISTGELKSTDASIDSKDRVPLQLKDQDFARFLYEHIGRLLKSKLVCLFSLGSLSIGLSWIIRPDILGFPFRFRIIVDHPP